MSTRKNPLKSLYARSSCSMICQIRGRILYDVLCTWGAKGFLHSRKLHFYPWSTIVTFTVIHCRDSWQQFKEIPVKEQLLPLPLKESYTYPYLFPWNCQLLLLGNLKTTEAAHVQCKLLDYICTANHCLSTAELVMPSCVLCCLLLGAMKRIHHCYIH